MARSRVCAGRAASAVLPCPQSLTRPVARFAERTSACGPQVRPRAPAKILAPGPSCVSEPQLTRIVSWPVVTEPTGIHHDFSNTSFAHGYSSSSLTTPVRQSVSKRVTPAHLSRERVIVPGLSLHVMPAPPRPRGAFSVRGARAFPVGIESEGFPNRCRQGELGKLIRLGS